ncbi:MAG: TolC family protein, partial [Deltaproteobacteria bacterium]|nr:TolC family protein [Deltaproteobacteria bacterium]
MHRRPPSLAPFFLLFLCLFSPPLLLAQEPVITLSDAIGKTLELNPGVKIEEEQVVQSEGALQTATGQFDWIGLGSAYREQERYHFPDSEEQDGRLATLTGTRWVTDSWREEATGYSLGLRKQFREGLVFYPSVSNLNVEDLSEDIETQSRSDLHVEFVIPLMRGLGKENTAAGEMAARSSLDATKLLSKHDISGRIYLTSVSYWNCLAALKNVQILEDREKRAEEVSRLVDRLVRVGEMEPAARRQAQAKLYQRQADIRDSRSSVYQARQGLGVAIGYTPRELPRAPLPEGSFPPVVQKSFLDDERTSQYVDLALEKRGDYLASLTNVEIEKILLQKARNDIKPRLDFTFRFGVSGFNERDDSTRYVRSLYHDHAGPNVFGGLTLELPIENNAAKGEFVRRSSLVREAQYTAESFSNGIASDVLVSVERLRSAIKEYRLAAESTSAYRDAADHENFKVRQGTTELNDLIDMEDRYYTARARQVE